VIELFASGFGLVCANPKPFLFVTGKTKKAFFKGVKIMSENAILAQVTDDLVVTMDYTLTVDGEIVDSSKGGGAIRFVQGQGEIIPGLERQLNGLALGGRQTFTVSAKEGYGEFEDDRLVDIPREEFPESIPLELGVHLRMKDEEGNPLQARIHEIADDFVKLNFNHVLAGKELQFDVTIVELRAATPEELEHGHVH
jgi:FKBP-type peptidyl-prolyl cis-trans isomerase SlyD